MVDCASCKQKSCAKGEPCPIGAPLKERALNEYSGKKNSKLYQKSSTLEVEGYMEYSRVKELLLLAEDMGWKKLGIAFCIGLSEEAEKLQKILKSKGFEVHSVVCKVGSVKKNELALPQKDGESACNPVLQAMILNEIGTDLNVLMGLCLGHDILFQEHSDAPTTTLVVKDRVLAHNPVGALYSRYYRKILLEGRKGG